MTLFFFPFLNPGDRLLLFSVNCDVYFPTVCQHGLCLHLPAPRVWWLQLSLLGDPDQVEDKTEGWRCRCTSHLSFHAFSTRVYIGELRWIVGQMSRANLGSSSGFYSSSYCAFTWLPLIYSLREVSNSWLVASDIMFLFFVFFTWIFCFQDNN